MKYAITITFETPERIPPKALKEVAAACFVQLEGLKDDHGVDYHSDQVRASRVKPSCGKLENALRCLVVRFPIEGWAARPDGGCACVQYEDHGECRHTTAVKALAELDKKRA